MRLTFSKTCVTRVTKRMLRFAIYNSSQDSYGTVWDVKSDIPQNASWRFGGGEVLQTLKNDRAVPDATDTCIEIA